MTCIRAWCCALLDSHLMARHGVPTVGVNAAACRGIVTTQKLLELAFVFWIGGRAYLVLHLDGCFWVQKNAANHPEVPTASGAWKPTMPQPPGARSKGPRDRSYEGDEVKEICKTNLGQRQGAGRAAAIRAHCVERLAPLELSNLQTATQAIVQCGRWKCCRANTIRQIQLGSASRLLKAAVSLDRSQHAQCYCCLAAKLPWRSCEPGSCSQTNSNRLP